MNERRDLVEAVTHKLLSKLGPDLEFLRANGIGVTILAFEYKAPGATAYISTADRPSMIEGLKEFLAYQEAGMTTEPRGERGQG